MLLLLHGLHLTGAPRVALDLLAAMGPAVSVRSVSAGLGPLAGEAEALGPIDVPDLGVAGPAGAVRRVLRRVARARLEAALRRWRPDVVYVNSVAALPVADVVRVPEVPVLLHVHELDSYLEYYARHHRRALLEWPDRYVAVSGPVRDALLGLGVPAGKVAVVHECVRSADYAADAAAGADPRPDGPLTVGGAGRVDLRKGPALWLQVVAELVRLVGRAGVRGVWVGVDDDVPSRQFRMMSGKLGLDGVVGFVPVTPDPLSHYRAFDVFACTSWEDPCPLVVAENMMLGTPVACFAGGGGAPEQVGEAGLVVPDFCPRRMADAILAAARSPDGLPGLGRAARRRAAERFSDRVQAPRMLDEIDRAIGGRMTPGRPGPAARG